jgi:hypothetical protein
MPRYRIHRIKEAPGESFRWAAHSGGLAIAKTKDYEFAGEVEASTPYAAWKKLTTENRPIRPGDLLETVSVDGAPGELQIAKYIGFEPAQWYVPEPKPDTSTDSSELSVAGRPAVPGHSL